MYEFAGVCAKAPCRLYFMRFMRYLRGLPVAGLLWDEGLGSHSVRLVLMNVMTLSVGCVVCVCVFSRHDTAHLCGPFCLCFGVAPSVLSLVLVAAGLPSSSSCPHTPFILSPTTGKGFGKNMDLTIERLNGVKDTVELGEDDTPAVMRRKVASAVGLPEDGFVMSFGGVAVDSGYDMTQLSAGDTVVLTMVTKQVARAALHALGETDITAERLESVEDPEVACLLLQAEVATVIPDMFLWKASLTSLDLSAESVVTRIGDHFLKCCTSLTSIDLSGLIHVKHIGMGFLNKCRSLCSLDLSPLRNVIKINPYCFLDGCTSLESIYLTGCSDVVSTRVRERELWEFVVESRPKRSRDEPPEESRE